LNTVRRMIQQKRDVSDEHATKLSQLHLRLEEIAKSVGEFEAERSVLIKSAMESGTAKIEAELGSVTNELNALKKERQEATEYLDKMRQVSPYLSKMFSDQKEKIIQAESQIVSLSDKLREAEARKQEMVALQAQLNGERSAFEAELKTAQDKIGAVRKEKDEQDLRLQSAKDRLNQLTGEQGSAEERLSSLKEKMKFYEESFSEATKRIEELESILTSQKGELGEIHETRLRFERLRQKVEQQLDLAVLILEKTQNAVTKYDSDLSALESVAGEEIALSKLESLGEASAIRGYRGPLRSLLSFEEKYSQAIAALGKDWLNAVVVDDVESLINVAESARKLKISRLTTIPISEVSDFEETPLPETQGVLSSATEVISCEPRIKKILNFVFGDSVIVDSPRSAFVAARMGFRAVTLQGDVFEPEILAFETGYSKRYARISEILGRQESFEGIKKTLGLFRSLIGKRKESIAKLHSKSERFSEDEQGRNINVSKIEARLESSRQYVGKYAEISNFQRVKQKQLEEEITNMGEGVSNARKLLDEQVLVCENLAIKISQMDLSAVEAKSSEITRKKMDLDTRLEGVMSEIREIMTDTTRVRGDLENNQKLTLERLGQQLAETESTVATRTRLLAETEPKLRELEAKFAELKAEEDRTLEKANRFQPMLEAIDYKLKGLRTEEELTRKTVSSIEREQIAASLDLDRLVESEKNLLGQLSLFGYAEPIEMFDGAEELLRELNAEFDALRNNVNLLADKNYREIFENYKYSSERKNSLEKERNAIVIFIETIDAEKRKVFMDAFERIDKELRLIFTKVTDGSAWLEIENPDSIFDSGIFLMTQFPGKLPRDSSSVSGGEKTISALSFILAIQAVFPSPFYVFDEVDAHLDSNYSGRIGEILAERASFSQIIIVSLKDTVVSKANSVIGVYMSQGSSKIIRYRTGMEVELRTEQ
ncbi:MAG: hypothetical protein ACREBQ_03460, partial [Nitrososphaerales archaeon]